MTQILSWGREDIRPDRVSARMARGPTGWTLDVEAPDLDGLDLPAHARVSAVLRHPSHVALPRIEFGTVGGARAAGRRHFGDADRPDAFTVDLMVTDPVTHEIYGRCFGAVPVVDRPEPAMAEGGGKSFISVVEDADLGVPLRFECRSGGPAIAWCRSPRGRASVFDGPRHLRDPLNRAVLLTMAVEAWATHLLSPAGEDAAGPAWDDARLFVARLLGRDTWREAMEVGGGTPEEKGRCAAEALYRGPLAAALEAHVRAAEAASEGE